MDAPRLPDYLRMSAGTRARQSHAEHAELKNRFIADLVAGNAAGPVARQGLPSCRRKLPER